MHTCRLTQSVSNRPEDLNFNGFDNKLSWDLTALYYYFMAYSKSNHYCTQCPLVKRFRDSIYGVISPISVNRLSNFLALLTMRDINQARDVATTMMVIGSVGQHHSLIFKGKLMNGYCKGTFLWDTRYLSSISPSQESMSILWCNAVSVSKE